MRRLYMNLLNNIWDFVVYLKRLSIRCPAVTANTVFSDLVRSADIVKWCLTSRTGQLFISKFYKEKTYKLKKEGS